MKNKMYYLIIAAILILTACDPRALAASLNTPERHDFPQDNVVCYTYGTTISCVKK